MKPMQISGLGLVGGFGCGKQALLSALEQGRVEPTEVELRGAAFPLYRADTSPLEEYLPKRALRRIDHFSRLALLGAYQALADAGEAELERSRLGLIVGSGFGALQTTFRFLDSVLEDGDPFASPTAFSNSVHNAAAAHISMQLKLTGPSLTISQFDLSLASSLLTAQQWLAEGRVEAVLLGVVDEYCSVLGYCWERFLGARGRGRMHPFEASGATAIAGEGAAFFLLQPASTKTDGVQICAVRLGQQAARLEFSENAPLLLSADGLPDGNRYRQLGAQPVACYTPLYGASPVAPAFDLAVATLALQRGRLFASAAEREDGFPAGLIETERPCSSLGCLRFGLQGEYALVQLQTERKDG